MKEEKAVKLYQGITEIGDDLIEEAGMSQAQKRKKTASWRWAAVAACLCAALLGTAAAEQYFGVRIVDGLGGDEEPDVWLEGGIAYYRVDSLSDEVEELNDPYYAVKAFDSWNEMEEFIGVEMMNNPVLDASPAKRYSYVWNDGVNRTQGRFLAVGSAGLTSIYTIGCYEINEVNICVQGFLFTDRITEKNKDWDERFLGYSFPDDTRLDWESYITPNGLEAQIMEVDHGGHDKYRAVLSLNGVPFVVTASSGESIDVNREALFQALDGFQI